MEYHGTAGDDTLDESALALPPGSIIYGGNGNDRITLVSATAIGGAGNDIITASSAWASVAYWASPAGVNVNLALGTASDGFGTTDTLIGVRSVHDSGNNDTITGSAAAESFWLSWGSDRVDGGGGWDTVNFWAIAYGEVQVTYTSSTDTFTIRKQTAAGDNGVTELTGVEEIRFMASGAGTVTVARDMFVPIAGFQRSTLQASSADMHEVNQLRVGDFNGDGLADVLVARTRGDLGATPVALQVMLGNKQGGFTDGTAQVFAGGIPFVNFVPRLFVADFNSDGVADIFCPDFGLDAPPFPGGQNSLFVSAPGTRLLTNLGATLPQALRQNHGASIGDVNNDGHVDLLVNALNEWTGPPNDLLINDGTGRFTSSPQLLPASVRSQTAGHTYSMMADVTGDGHVDIVLGTWDNNAMPSQVLINDGRGSFAAAVPVALPASGIAQEVVLDIQRLDLNGDDLPDLVLSVTNGGAHGTFYQTPYLQLLVNEGGGQFRDETALRLPQQVPDPVPGAGGAPWFISVTPLDFNRDGHTDLLADGMGRSAVLYLNDGTGRFAASWEGASGQHVAAADVDQDGLTDIIVATSSGFDVLMNRMADGGVVRAGFDGESMHATSRSEQFVGRGGLDTVIYTGNASAYTVRQTTQGFEVLDGSSGLADTLVGVERLQFDDARIALDIDGNAGIAYRLYKAAFDRVPDLGGLGYQMRDLDRGWDPVWVANNFIASPEFQLRYGALDNAEFVRQLYLNVLDREPDAGGWAYHIARIEAGAPRAAILIGFSESPENKDNVIGAIQDGMLYTI